MTQQPLSSLAKLRFLAFTLLLVLPCARSLANIKLSHEDAIARYTHKIVTHVTWPDEQDSGTLVIGILSNNATQLESFNNYLHLKQVRNKTLSVEAITSKKIPEGRYALLFVNNESLHRITDKLLNDTKLLIVTDSGTRQDKRITRLAVVNRKIKIHLHRETLVSNGFSISNALLEHTGTKEDLKAQLRAQEKHLNDLMRETQVKEEQLKALNDTLTKTNSTLAKTRSDLQYKSTKLNENQIKLDQLNSKLSLIQSKIAQGQNEVAQLNALIEKKQRELANQRWSMKEKNMEVRKLKAQKTINQEELEKKATLIDSQKATIQYTQDAIRQQRILLLIASFTAVVFLIMAYVLLLLNTIRKKNNSKLARLNANLYELATTDSMTKLFNRRHFIESSENLILQQRRNSARSCVLLMDIDHFKRVNDTYGHAVGDEVIVRVADILIANLRKHDIVGRLGGEEFAMVLWDCSVNAAFTIAQRLRSEVQNSSVNTKHGEVGFTISIGLTEIIPNKDDIDQALLRADSALYAAKSNGRNQVFVSEI